MPNNEPLMLAEVVHCIFLPQDRHKTADQWAFHSRYFACIYQAFIFG